MLPTEMKLCCRILGIAITAKLLKWAQENSLALPSDFILLKRRKTKSNARTQLTPWHKKVAQATPATPILNKVTNKISAPMLAKEEQAKKTNGVFESPKEEKIPVATL